MKKVLALSTSPFPYRNNITDGPGYRAWNLLQEVSKKHEVVILSLYESFHLKLHNEFEVLEDNISVKCIGHNPGRIARQIEDERPDLLYLPWSSTPFLSRLNRKIPTIIDYVGAGLLEDYVTKGYISTALMKMKLNSFWQGDFFITAGQRERYYLLGLMVASKKLCYRVYNQKNPLINVIPMTPPQKTPILKEQVIEKKSGEIVFLVAGAFLPWYDYHTFFEALKILIIEGMKNFKVIIMGGNIRDPKFEASVRRIGDVEGLRDKLIFTGIVPFKARENYYLSADAAVNIPSVNIEDELSVRTRIVDYIWSNLPIISPANDEYSSLVIHKDAGFKYTAGDSQSLSATFSQVMNQPSKLEQAKSRMPSLLENEFNIGKYFTLLESFIDNPFVDPSRRAPKGIGSDLFLLARDVLGLLKR
jgi:glycosyltransferase involved in cell wall biosynthesis